MAFYFAYGDRMNAEKMAGSTPGARLVGPGRVDGYRLAFNVHSRAWGGGAANAMPDPRSSLWGVLWELDDQELEELEPINRGGVATDDRVLDVDVEGPEGVVRARTFAVESHEAIVRPTDRYFEMLRATALAQGLPEDAIAALDRARETPQEPAPHI
jgi:AIG2-like family